MPPSGNNSQDNGGCTGRTIITILVAVLVIALVIGLFVWLFSSAAEDSAVAKSTVERTALAPSAVDETGYYTDEDGHWIDRPNELESGMRSFYKETGVQPYLYILPNGETESTQELGEYAEELYDELFDDEGHFLLVFCDDDEGSYNCGYVVGTQAKTVMDDEAIGILADYLDRYYYDYSLSEEEIFSRAFADTGRRIMTVYQSPVVPVFICIAVVVVAIAVFVILKKRREQRAQEQKQLEEILKTPLEKFGDGEAEELAKKYEAQEQEVRTEGQTVAQTGEQEENR